MDDPREIQVDPTGKPTRPARRKAVILPAVAALAVAGTAAAVLLPGAFAAAEDPAESDSKADAGKAAQNVEQPEYPLPDLPPLEDNQRYLWDSLDDGRQSDAADEYGAAFYDWFDAADFTFTDDSDIVVQDLEIIKETQSGDGSATGDPTGEKIPVYSVWAEARTGNEHGDMLSMRVHPKAAFKAGAGEGYEYLASCTDYEEQVDGFTAAVRFDCEQTERAGGSKLLTVTESRVNSATDGLFRIKNTAVLFRADGTAVVVSDETPSIGYTGEYPVDADVTPHFGAEELTELAQSMPDTIVEG